MNVKRMVLVAFSAALLGCGCLGVVMAEDILFMPSAMQVAGGEEKLRYYRIWPGAGESPGRMDALFTYSAISDAIELSWVKLWPEGLEKESALNISMRFSPETLETAASTIGVTNVTGRQYQDSDDPAYFVAFAKTLNLRREPATLTDPLYRYHMGYGTKLHDGFFGGLEIIVSRRMKLYGINYRGRSSYLASYEARGRGVKLGVQGGYLDGQPFAGLTYAGGLP